MMPTPFPDLNNFNTNTAVVLFYWLALGGFVTTFTLFLFLGLYKTTKALIGRHHTTTKYKLKWMGITTAFFLCWVQVTLLVTLEGVLIYKQGAGSGGAGGMPVPTTYYKKTTTLATPVSDETAIRTR